MKIFPAARATSALTTRALRDPVLEALKSVYARGGLTLEELERRVGLHLRQREVHERFCDAG